ncbi:helix-turn-helix transcriptional regulator [Bizionia gelidisalsuginis]|uniref:Helix-turn-helix transcriptional regulator n=2 Tax=Bizionia TaxID=283785 RepID=A0A8H2QKX5_9FLAO|nr:MULTISPECIES: helix-turn-helix transcriptional regulator [Bizionia]TYB72603.1 helix-turn-helix transcriptional regulator [Bizionia saleffrena]TYC18155.1 helix-turn-helix transcriptional regulator [Bizionia gelidisalsuginis]
MNFIAKKISETRKVKGLSQEELAELSKINLRTIQRIENSENEPRGKTLNLICNVLEIDIKELFSNNNSLKEKNIGTKLVNGLFLLALNLVLMGVIGFLTLDSNANMNSLFGGILLSFFIPFFIVFLTQNINGMERMLKFGCGYFAYFIFVIFKLGFPTGFVSGLFPCLLISVSVLYFGNALINNKE